MSQAVAPATAPAEGSGVANARRAARYATQVAAYVVAYYFAARLGLGFRFENSQIAVVWPPNAVFVAALLLTPRKHWWLVFLATVLAHVAAMGDTIPPWRVAWQLGGNAVFALLTVGCLERFAKLPLRFDGRRQVFVFTLVSFVTPVLFAFVTAGFVRSLLHLEPEEAPAMRLIRIALTNVTSMLLVVPAILLWAQGGIRSVFELPARRRAEAAGVLISIGAVGVAAFGAGPRIAHLPWLLLWIFPPLLWAAVRFGPAGASTSLFCVAALSIWGTASRMGPFVFMTNADQVLSLQVFWLVLAPPVLLLAAVIREREQVEDTLVDQRKQLAHATRVATVGELSGTLAHELRQPLSSILANAQAALLFLDRESIDRSELRLIMRDIIQQDRQAAAVIDRLRSFLKSGDSHFELVAMESIVRDALALSRGLPEISRIDVQTDIDAGLPRVLGDSVQLLQVMVNLIVNGGESMVELPDADRRLSIRVHTPDPDHVEVVVADSGPGLPPGGENLVFEPFFTTKHTGLGLGLAISRSIVIAHGGRLSGESNADRGASFRMILPARRVAPAVGS